jgi:eukaryotic-like serine/threonine-protein kinase
VLSVVAGPDAGRVVEWTTKGLVIGRGDKADLTLADPSVSRIHCALEAKNGRITLSDRGSSSGTFVNGSQVTEVELKSGTNIQIGDSVIRIEIRNPDASTMVAPVAGPVSKLSELIGKSFGPFQLEAVIGTGKTGLVFRATDADKSRTVAVKVLSPQFSTTEEQKQRFIRAMKTTLQIRSKNIVEVLDAGKSGAYCWAAMEYVDGESLATLIQRTGIQGMMDWKKVWKVAVDVTQALHAGFVAQVLHRNVTPSNILLRSNDQTCLLSDYFLAKALEGAQAFDVTQPGHVVGDLAPERTIANGYVGTESDVFGLGATCYALLTGKPPATGNTMVEVLKSVREVVPVHPKSIQLSIDELFEGVVMKMIAKKPTDRFSTPATLLKELVRVGKLRGLNVDSIL